MKTYERNECCGHRPLLQINNLDAFGRGAARVQIAQVLRHRANPFDRLRAGLAIADKAISGLIFWGVLELLAISS